MPMFDNGLSNDKTTLLAEVETLISSIRAVLEVVFEDDVGFEDFTVDQLKRLISDLRQINHDFKGV
jgi:hypothetical protein